MSYEDSIRREREKNAQMRTAEDIQARLEKIMLSGADEAARRWCWELIQNACDVAPPDRDVSIEVMIEESGDGTYLVFRHNGGVFSSKDLVRLTQQSSNKRGEKVEGKAAEARPESIGRFGTGFLTTHLLSRKVEVESILHDATELPREFTLPLDRSGETPEEIHEGVEQTFEALSGIDDSDPVEYDPEDLNTVFRYRLDESGVDVARKGIEDLHRHLPLVLAFHDRIGQVDIVHEGVMYQVAAREQIESREGGDVERVAVARDNGENSETHDLLLCRSDRTDVAVPIELSDGDISICQLEDQTPRLFCAYPLLGTSGFPIPVVVNSAAFHPTEPRDGVHLTDADHHKPNTNKAIFREAVESIQTLIGVCSNREWNDLYHFARMDEPDRRGWLSQSWYKENVLQPIRQTLLREPIVELASGDRTPIQDEEGNEQVEFPNGGSKEYREEYLELCASYEGHKLPTKKHVHEWNDLIWGAGQRMYVGAVTLVARISNLNNLENLCSKRSISKKEALEWLSRVYKYLVRHEKVKYLNEHNYWGKSRRDPLLPDQNGTFRLASEVSFDDEIPPDLKDIAQELGRDVRSELLHSALSPDLKLGTINAEDLALDISSEVRERFKETNRSEQTRKAFRSLLHWFDEHPQLGEDLFGDIFEKKHRLRTDEEAREDRQKARRFQKQQDALEERGYSSIEEILDKIDQMEQSDQEEQADSASSSDQDETREELANLLVELGISTTDDLADERERNPGIFRHYSEHSLERLNRFLQMLERVKARVREHLAANDKYDVSAWTEHEKYPTVVTIQKRGHDTHIVLRPADQGKIIFYASMELDVLELPDAELWVQAENQPPIQVTPGRLLRSLGVEAGSGIKFTAATSSLSEKESG